MTKSVITIPFYDSKDYDKLFLPRYCNGITTSDGKEIKLRFIKAHLTRKTVEYAKGCPAVCVFVNDNCDKSFVDTFAKYGVKLILCRSAGFNNVDLNACKEHGIDVLRVPAYSPYAVAEHVLTLFLCLNRKIHIAHNRVRDGNFSLNGLEGRDLNGLTCGVFGTGKIGGIFAGLAHGVGMKVLLWDPFPNQKLAQAVHGTYIKDKAEMLSKCDVISLHLPLIKDKTVHFINAEAIGHMKPRAILLNASRGPIVDSKALLDGLLSGKLGGAAIDVYENEAKYFFNDVSAKPIDDPILARLVNMPNCLVTSHQAFLTETALKNIADCTAFNIKEYFVENKRGDKLTNVPYLGGAPPKKAKM